MREKICFDNDWLFHEGDIVRDYPINKAAVYYSAKTERELWGPASRNYETGFYATEPWESVNLPHDYVIRGIPDKRYNETLGFLEYKNAWYIKKFHLDKVDEKRRITLLFEGVATRATVYVNGCHMKHSFTGYTPFEVDITDVCEFDAENTVAVYVSTEEHEGWWYEGGGIYRHVWLIKTDLVSVDLYGVYANPKKISDGLWRVDTEITLRNDDFASHRVKALGEIIDSDGNCVATAESTASIGENSKKELTYSFDVVSPELWSPDTPNQYTMRTKIMVGKREADVYDVKFGFRTLLADPRHGLFINGKHYKIQGVCAHADCGLMGKAVPDNVHRYKVKMIKEMGANGYRTSHYPQAEALMDALDDNGFIVMNEVRWFTSTEEGISQLETLIKRDRNRPGVVFWSLGNEELHHVTEQGRRIARKMLSTVKRLDKSRFVMTAINITPENATVCDELDLIGVNYCWEAYAAVHEKYPDKAVVSSENGATGTTRGWYFPDNAEKAFITAYDHDTNEMYKSREYTWKFITEREWMMGGYQWAAFEHRGEAVWPRLCSQSGAIDLFLQKKDAFYQNKSFWTKEPMVHLLPHWNFRGLEGEPIKVFAYTNTDSLELFLNGESLGKRKIERFGHGEWTVPYNPGKLEVLAYKDGEVVARAEKITSKAASKLALTLESRDISANGKDIAILTCYAVDEDGNEVCDAEPTVRFSTNSLGSIYSTGSDITEHDTIFKSTRKMRAGRISVAVKLGEVAGELKVYAESEGLLSAVLSVKIDS